METVHAAGGHRLSCSVDLTRDQRVKDGSLAARSIEERGVTSCSRLVTSAASEISVREGVRLWVGQKVEGEAAACESLDDRGVAVCASGGTLE